MRVAAAALNRVDLYVRGSGAGITQTLPPVMGVEGAGVIVEAEPGSGLTPGMKAILYSEACCGKCRYLPSWRSAALRICPYLRRAP
jgi:NADPH:quinone reductase-like Zn-dependent oxidoreductase